MTAYCKFPAQSFLALKLSWAAYRGTKRRDGELKSK